MKFNIISVDDSRQKYKDHIRSVVMIEEIKIPSFFAANRNVKNALQERGLFVKYPEAFSIGEIGIWISMFDCWQWAVDNQEELVTFEDDAIPKHYFDEAVDLFTKEATDYDFICLWVPPNQMQDYNYDVVYDDDGNPDIRGVKSPSLFDYGAKYLAKTYNGYGNVATLFSPKGAEFFINRVREAGIYTPLDCFLYQEAHAGRCIGYSPKPFHATVVDYDWAETTVHATQRFNEVYSEDL